MINLKDVKGNSIAPGIRVAYNLSGTVALGEVLEVIDKGPIAVYQKSTVNARKVFVFIKFEDEWKGLGAKRGISRIVEITNIPHPISGECVCHKIVAI